MHFRNWKSFCSGGSLSNVRCTCSRWCETFYSWIRWMKVVNVSLRHMFRKNIRERLIPWCVGSVMQTLSINVMISNFSLSSINLHSFHLLATTICTQKMALLQVHNLWITQEKWLSRTFGQTISVRESQRKEIVKITFVWVYILDPFNS